LCEIIDLPHFAWISDLFWEIFLYIFSKFRFFSKIHIKLFPLSQHQNTKPLEIYEDNNKIKLWKFYKKSILLPIFLLSWRSPCLKNGTPLVLWVLFQYHFKSYFYCW
jgi:hypothetical protein